MACCRVNKCCCCIELPMGIRILSLFLILVEILGIVLVIELSPQFIFFAVPTCSVGIICHCITFVVITFGLHRGMSRWMLLPWLIYIMVLVVGLALAAILQIVIPLGSSQTQNWPLIVGLAGVCLVIGGLYLYFWIVVLELFIKMAPAMYQMSSDVMTQPPSLTFHQPMTMSNFQIFPALQQVYQPNGQQMLVPVTQQYYG